MKKSVIIILIPLFAIIILFSVRLISPTEIDDVSPEIPCPEMQSYNPDILYIIPNFDGKPISKNESWCSYILSLNKTLGLHGINHEYREFLNKNFSGEELNFAKEEFEKCFNQTPEKFKAPQLKINEENKKLLSENNLKLQTTFKQLTRKVYHCDDEGKIKNRWIKIF